MRDIRICDIDSQAYGLNRHVLGPYEEGATINIYMYRIYEKTFTLDSGPRIASVRLVPVSPHYNSGS